MQQIALCLFTQKDPKSRNQPVTFFKTGSDTMTSWTRVNGTTTIFQIVTYGQIRFKSVISDFVSFSSWTVLY